MLLSFLIVKEGFCLDIPKITFLLVGSDNILLAKKTPS